MAHMFEALDNGEDIGHYGRHVFAMIGRHFVSNDELVELLTKDHDAGEQGSGRWYTASPIGCGAAARSWVVARQTLYSSPTALKG
jgi:hypothetical protein